MDRIKAQKLEISLKGKTISGYKVICLINNGKSAAVFKAKKANSFYALKIFDNELIERFGHQIQIERIEKEIALKNHQIDNLVKIIDGGSINHDGQNFYFIIMEYIEGQNLKEYICNNQYNQEFIINTLHALIKATEQLIDLGIAHRDIKPENIMVKHDGEVILMDLGVLKLIGAKSLSDYEEVQFVGTLRYAAPEFLMRGEEDSIDGWKAVNIYQIGATLHDLIMKKEIFYDKKPYPNLVIAIKDEYPIILHEEICFELLQLTRDMLVKDWKKRLSLFDIKKVTNIKNSRSNLDIELDNFNKKRISKQTLFDELNQLQKTKQEKQERQKKNMSVLSEIIDKSVHILKEKELFISFEKSPLFSIESIPKSHVQYCIYELKGDLQMGFPRNMLLLVKICCDEDSWVQIELLGIFIFTQVNLKHPKSILSDIMQEYKFMNRKKDEVYGTREISTFVAFSGLANFENDFLEHITLKIFKLIKKSLEIAEDEVNAIIDRKKNQLIGNNININFANKGFEKLILVNEI